MEFDALDSLGWPSVHCRFQENYVGCAASGPRWFFDGSRWLVPAGFAAGCRWSGCRWYNLDLTSDYCKYSLYQATLPSQVTFAAGTT